ncbi:MAG: AmmeMemoRadiSam system protein B [Ignavibacteriales bacterium]|nr:AmmeMemoRadiSam system protein B [Ignavibacteriales bacterium]
MSRVRKPAAAGSFYDGDSETLRDHVDRLLDQADAPDVKGPIRGLVSPHAGYMYSGMAAATGYKALRGSKYDAVLMVGPSHREYFDGVSVYPGDAYRTPLGDVPVHQEIRKALVEESPYIEASEIGHRGEHSLEVQLPFLQRVLGDFSFVPMIIGNQTKEVCPALGGAIARATRGKNVLLVASSDLSHYHPYADAVRLDRRVIDQVEAFDETALMAQIVAEQVEACGGGPVVSVMRASKLMGARRSQILFYCNSGDVTGDKTAVVGYLSAAFL